MDRIISLSATREYLKRECFMKRLMISLIGLLGFCLSISSYAAEQAWISDALQTSVSDAPEVNGKYIGSLKAGVPITVLGKSKDGRYMHIKTEHLEGWVWAKNIMYSPSIQIRFNEQNTQLNQLQSQNTVLANDKENHTAMISTLQNRLAVAEENATRSRAELVALQRASANVVAIDARNRELQSQVVTLEQENLNLRHSNKRLEEDKSQKQMTIGGLLVVAGFLLNGLLGMMRTHRRRDSFNDL